MLLGQGPTFYHVHYIVACCYGSSATAHSSCMSTVDGGVASENSHRVRVQKSYQFKPCSEQKLSIHVVDPLVVLLHALRLVV